MGSTDLPRLRTLQLAVKDKQELEEKLEEGKSVGDGIGRDSCMEDEKQHVVGRIKQLAVAE